MMELKTCAFIVAFISSVIANPHGYGVKGGASASAVSGASAGAYRALGNIPFGDSFSGSFSKSSSSSTSSSSASSSSSSSSFRYSGSVPGDYSSLSTYGNIGCTSGLCQNSGANALSTNFGTTGAGSHGYSSVNAAAAAATEEEIGSGADCQGPECISNSEKCSFDQCLSKPQTENSPHSHDANEKCANGQCRSTPTVPLTSQDDVTDDIHFVAHLSKPAHDSNDQTSNNHKGTGYKAGFSCHDGNCGLSHVNSGKQLPTTKNSGVTESYHSPSIHLETPKQDSNCNSGNCNTKYSSPDFDTPLSSYNVPIHGTYDTNTQKAPCIDGKCDSTQTMSYSINGNSLPTNYLTPQNSPTPHYQSTPSCTGSNCGSLTLSQVDDKPVITTSNDNQYGLSPSEVSSTRCNSPYCSPHYAVSAPINPNLQPGQINLAHTVEKDKIHHITPNVFTNQPTEKLKPNDYDVPMSIASKPTQSTSPLYDTGCKTANCYGTVIADSSSANTLQSGSHSVHKQGEGDVYTGGFGGASGMLKPNEFDIKITTIPAHSTGPSYTSLPDVPSITGCKTQNCVGYSPTTGAVGNTQSELYGATKPSIVKDSSSKSPPYMGSFGGPPGLLKPNEFDIKVTTKPAHPTSPSYTSHPLVPSTSGCKTPNCMGYAPVSSAAANTQSGLYGATKPSILENSSSESTPYTGSFGGPAGLLKPNEFDLKVTTKPAYSVSPSYTGNTLVPSTTGCKTPNCVGYASTASTTAKSQSELYGTTKPNVVEVSSSPPYTGSFGGPTGLLKPNEFDITHTVPNSHNPNQSSSNKTATNINSAGCSTPQCSPSSVGSVIVTNAQSPFSITKPITYSDHGYTSNYIRPVGVTYPSPVAVAPINPNYASPLQPIGTYCKTANCATYPTNGMTTVVNSPPGLGHTSSLHGDSKLSNPPNPGFNTHIGSIKTSDHSHNLSSTISGSTNCKTSDCANTDSIYIGSNLHSGSYTGWKQPPSVYTNGFGVPPVDLLKPQDDSIFAGSSKPNDYIKPTGTGSPTTCTSGYCNPKAIPPSSVPGYDVALSGAHASASASADAVAYTGGFGGPPGILKAYDDEKIDLTKLSDVQNQGIHYDATNIHSSHDTNLATHGDSTPANTGTAGQLGHNNIGALSGSAAGASAFSESVATSQADSYGYSDHGKHQAGYDVKGLSPCSGGCDGGHQDGLTGSGNLAAAGAKSLSTAGGFGLGGAFASSSASAHASAGAYTKGGYGKR